MSKLQFLVWMLFGGCVLGLRGRSSSQCGVPFSDGKIVGGVDSGGYRYPWFALLLLKKNSFLPVPVCAGSLITKYHVLTAAHCLTISASVQPKNLYTVALGVYNICNENESSRQTFDVAAVAIHEKYQRSGKFYDIAIMKLDRPADYAFICLPIPGVPDITEVAVIIGFGVTGESSSFQPCHLLEVNVTKYSKEDCGKTKLPLEDKKEPTVICAGSLSGEVDSCYGDSGGPLQTITPDGRYVLAGIVSFGYGCGTPNLPGLYTNVGSYLQWINNKISTLDTKQDTTRKQNSFKPPVQSLPVNPRKQNVLFPEQSSNRPPIGIHDFSRRLTSNGTNSVGSKRQRDDRLKKSKKGSSVTFPE